ncbi:shikimate kinase [Agromyces mediolanus]|uniref:shikimate kinase n=1 Tax=Agromyces mediolanus TaxID=41986 RepID=UPI00203D266C|nr:shikimate kinase [Agromyces mediolanus]MCM3657026.1 shikimate kinase [Agromyces mediolanus]
MTGAGAVPPGALGLPIVLIGPMGAGKSRVGQKLAAEAGVPFIDTDARITERYGPIEEIFAREGEEYFRVVEREIVAEALAEEAVVSLGGGAVLHPATRVDLAALPVVWLQVSAAAVAPRLAGSARPLIAQGGLDAWIRIRDERAPIYASLADLAIDTSRRSVARIVADITEHFGGTA